MSSPPKEKIETKAGHLPAVKVGGGMRIVQKHQSANEVPDKKQEEKDNKEYETEPVLNFLLLHTILLQSRMAAQLKAHQSCLLWSQELSLRGIKTSPLLLPRWPIRNLCPQYRSFLRPTTSTSTSTSLGSEPLTQL
ncbi:death-associated protein 1 homolog isoform X1 [Chanodichthys erythropterus]|uniref:death-associated protein 1 homolog isoform X1 n=1 Tax=Chanodichthys erythropterus TaxID=933992 RepID=UPI00351DBACA